MISFGRRNAIIMISKAKYAMTGQIPAEFKLKFLEHLDKQADRWLTAELIAQIEPMKRDGLDLVAEAMKLGPQEAFNLMQRDHVWAAFCALHPSFLAVTSAIDNDKQAAA
jgi:hypothetical protein